jgi:hypothetical protein
VIVVEAVPLKLAVSVTSDEMFCVPDCVCPMMVNVANETPSAVTLVDGGVIVIEDTLSATVAVVVPVTDPEAAVIVVVPTETPVKSPPVLRVATDGSELDQHTVVPVQLVPPVKVPVLPSLKVAAAVNWSGLDPGPKPTVGVGGSIVMVDTVGFTKKPLQATPRPRIRSAAKEPARRSLWLVGGIVI